MGTTINGIYIPDPNETAWDTPMNAGLTLLANAHVTARSRFLSVNEGMAYNAGTPVNVGTFPANIAYMPLSPSATTGYEWTFALPSDASTASITVRPVWAAALTDGTSHTVRWSVNTLALTAGTSSVAAGTDKPWTGDAASRTQDIVVVETGTSTTATWAAGSLIRLNLSRIGADAADTMTQTANLFGCRIDYVNL